MQRRVVIEDTAIESLASAVLGLTAQMENLANEVRRHQHFTNDATIDAGGLWSAQSDAFRFLKFDAVIDSLEDIRTQVEDLIA